MNWKCFWVVLLMAYAMSASAQQLTGNYDQMLNEVYGVSFFDGKQELRREFLRLLQERITYRRMPMDAEEKYPRLSQVDLLNKHNPNLQRDRNFDPATFNPLKYSLPFWSAKTTVIYRVDGTDYVLIIAPQRANQGQ